MHLRTIGATICEFTLSADIEHRFCNMSLKTLQSKRNFISISLAIFKFLAINILKWETNARAEKFNIVSNDHGRTRKCDFPVSDRKYPFWANLLQKIKIFSLS